MRKFLCSVFLAAVCSAQLNVDPKIDTTGGNEGEGDDVNTRFISTGNTAIDSFIGAAAGTVAANLAGGLFNGYREKCRFKRQAVDTKTAGGEDVDTRLFCLNDLLPRPVDCNRCNCYENSCRDCYQVLIVVLDTKNCPPIPNLYKFKTKNAYLI